MFQQRLVNLCHLAAGGAIYKDAVVQVHIYYLLEQLLRVARRCALKLLFVVLQIEPVWIEERAAAVGNSNYVKLQMALLHKGGVLLLYLLNEFSAHCAYTADEEVEHLVLREEEGVVQNIHCFA